MVDVEIRDSKDCLISVESLPFVPREGDYISIEKNEIFSYYDVKEVWLRLKEGESAIACVLVELND